MGFRNPITSAAAVDTGGVGTPSVYMTQGGNPMLAGGTFGEIGFRDGFPSDADAMITRTTGSSGHDGSTTGSLTLTGGSYAAGVAAPLIHLGVTSDAPGSFRPYASVSAAWDPLVPATALPLNATYFGPYDPAPPAFVKDADGEVLVTGRVVVTSTAFAFGVTIGTLPAGCRPAGTATQPVSFGLIGWNNALWRCDVFFDGRITCAANGPGATSTVGAFLSLDGIRFAAAN